MRTQFPTRWKDSATERVIIRDYPQTQTTIYMFSGVITHRVQVISARTLSQSD